MKFCRKAYMKVYNQIHKKEHQDYAKINYRKHTEKWKAYAKIYHREVRTSEHNTWYAMIQRCNNPNSRGYKHYGGRGIKVLYKSFKEFIQDVGPRSTSKHTIDRIDNDGDYAPGNCKWSTYKEQNKNRRNFKRRTSSEQ